MVKINPMKKFIQNLLSSESDQSSKRFAALFTLVNLIAMTWVATLKDDKFITPEFMYDSLALIAGGGLGLTVIEKIFTKKGKAPEVKDSSETPTP
jgi:hypothetical protein